jgi:eukaryotic-like serine/threonine-protein kinase
MKAGDAAGPFQLLRQVGAGAMAEVWQAQDARTGQTVAIKLMRRTADPHQATELERRFLQEASTARLLQHPDIVSVLDTGRTAAGQPWMALEWLTGQPLTQHCVAAHRLPADVVVALGQRLASALGHAHQRGVIHRDIKPDNLIFDAATGQLKIADFGVARAEDSGATQTGMVLGTPAYMAPEQLAGAPASPAGDLYSLGVVLFELLTSRRPVEAGSLGEWLRRISQEPATPLLSFRPDLPALLGDVVDQLLERDPALRPSRGEQVAQALLRCQHALQSGGA